MTFLTKLLVLLSAVIITGSVTFRYSQDLGMANSFAIVAAILAAAGINIWEASHRTLLTQTPTEPIQDLV